MKLLMMCID